MENTPSKNKLSLVSFFEKIIVPDSRECNGNLTKHVSKLHAG